MTSTFLSKVKSGKQVKPPRLMILGAPGVGKSTFAAGAPDVLFIDCERRTEHLDVRRLDATSWEEVLGTLREVCALGKKSDAPCKTLVVDTVDHLEALIQAHVCKANGWSSMEEPGYGKGYNIALEEWRTFVKAIEALRDVGITVVLLAHAAIRMYSNPGGADYDQWMLKLTKGAAALLREKVDATGFAAFEDASKAKFDRKGDQITRGKAETTGRRVLYFGHNPAYETKLGLGLPDEMDLEWSSLQEVLDNGK